MKRAIICFSIYFFLFTLYSENNSYSEDPILPKFTNVQSEVGIPFVGKLGKSATWGDYNNDGWPDLFLSNSDRKLRRRKFKRNIVDSPQYKTESAKTSFFFVSNQGQFQEISSYLNIPDERYSNASWADYDNDGFLDLLVGTNRAGMPVILYKNYNGVHFVDISGQARITKKGSTVAHGVWADYDNDGNVDFFQAGKNQSFLYRNKGDGTFEEVIESSGIIGRNYTNSAIWFDSNNDGLQDLFLSNNGFNTMYLNLGGGSFVDFTERAGLNGQSFWNTTSACVGDYNNDSYLDLYVTNIGLARNNALYKNNKDGTFTNVTMDTNTGDVGDGRTCAWIDFDADGKLDLFTTNHLQLNRLYRNLGNDSFKDVASEVGIEKPIDVFAATWADYDQDGYLDVFLNGHIGTALMKNYGNFNNSVTIKLDGDGLKSNSAAIGARVEVTAGKETQFKEVSGGRGCCEQDMLPLYFGIGNEDTVDIIIRWPSGKTCSFNDFLIENGKPNFFHIRELNCVIM